VNVYNVDKRLPDTNKQYDVYILGNLTPTYVNALRQNRDWFRDAWVNVAEDMALRGYIVHVYDTDGVMVNRSKVWYSFIDENSIIFAVQRGSHVYDPVPTAEVFVHFYSNSYFNTPEYNALSNPIGIDYVTSIVYTNVEKVALQTWITDHETHGGKCFVYVDGLYHDKVTLDIPDASTVEIVYDQSVISKEYTSISNLRQFTSDRFNDNRYLLYRTKVLDEIEYYDDTEVYVTTGNRNNNRGVFYYRHTAGSMYMGTDKDYTFNSQYVNNAATYVSTITDGAVDDKQIVLYIRRGGAPRSLVYSDMRVSELYKLPAPLQLDTLNGSGASVVDLRIEATENSMYFTVAGSTNPFTVTKEMYMQALGYNAVAYYFGYNVARNTPSLIIDVPELYQEPSTVYEYNTAGRLLGRDTTSGPTYVASSAAIAYVEFIKGVTPVVYSDYYLPEEEIVLNYSDYVVLSAVFLGVERITAWEDISGTSAVVTTGPGKIKVMETSGKKIYIQYLNEPNTYTLELDIAQGFLYFPITEYRYVNSIASNVITDTPYSNLDLFLNGYRLVEGLDYVVDYPYVSICNKKYIDYTLPLQKVEVRAYGYATDVDLINSIEIRGFVNNGVLGRNNIHDIRDDRVLSVYVGGKLIPREDVSYAEEDNTVRVADSLNGLPYLLSEPFISIKQVTGLPTVTWREASKAKDARIRDYFTMVLPEPAIDEFNVIPVRQTLYSPTISKILVDMLEHVIPESLYTNPYDDMAILDLLEANYKRILTMDPLKLGIQSSLVEIHPHLGNTVVNVNLYQYRFLTNLVRIIAGGQVNLSGYLSLTV
jgi:hypothetical protein